MKASAALSIHSGSADNLTARLDRARGRDAQLPGSVWEPVTPAPMVVAPAIVPNESAIIDAIVRPIGAGEGHLEGNARKERELMALFDALTPVQALAVRRRLAAASSDDALATAFGRLVIERRGRLIAFLDDTRRRHARR